MPDWIEVVRQRVIPLGQSPALQKWVLAELGAHLEEAFDHARSQGMTEAEAVEFALQEVENWHVLFADIQRATSEEDLMNYRTKSLWLPGLASVAAANLFLLALTQVSLQPQYLVQLNSGLGKTLYLGWLFAQVLFGALGAFLSRRAGGTRATRIVAGVFPAIVMFVLCGVVIPTSALFERNTILLRHPANLALGILVWVVAPAVTLLLGAAPFLKETKLHAA